MHDPIRRPQEKHEPLSRNLIEKSCCPTDIPIVALQVGSNSAVGKDLYPGSVDARFPGGKDRRRKALKVLQQEYVRISLDLVEEGRCPPALPVVRGDSRTKS